MPDSEELAYCSQGMCPKTSDLPSGIQVRSLSLTRSLVNGWGVPPWEETRYSFQAWPRFDSIDATVVHSGGEWRRWGWRGGYVSEVRPLASTMLAYRVWSG